MACLSERLSSVHALADVLSHADAGVVENAVSAASALPTLDRCADVPMLRAVLTPPDEPATRARVAAVREEVAKVNALATSGQCDRAASAGASVVGQANAVGYLPLEAEARYALGSLGDSCTAPTAATNELEEAVFAAEASRHDEIAIKAAVFLVSQYADRLHDVRMARNWLRHGEAILARFPGHPLLQAWIAVEKGLVLRAEGQDAAALEQEQHALALKEAALGPSHVDVAISSLNVALFLHELGRDREAEPLIVKSVGVFTELLGGDSAQLAVALLDESEILTALRRFDVAGVAIERALAIWRGRGASALFEGHGLLALGRLQLAEDQQQAARATLERATVLLRGADELTSGQASFALAQAMWATPGDRAKSLALARRARSMIGGDSSAARDTAAVDGWLSRHQVR
jgi:tetratricopeptide (TPR) repeat protein